MSAPDGNMRASARVALIALTASTASLDVTAFLRLGGVFASVMTSNLVFVGIAVVKTEAAFGTRCAVAILSYIVGVGIGSAIAPPSGDENRLGTRPLSLLLTGELAILVGYTIWWMVVDGHPRGWTQLVLLGVIACSMGGQSAAARQLGNPQRRHHLPHRHPDFPGQQPRRCAAAPTPRLWPSYSPSWPAPPPEQASSRPPRSPSHCWPWQASAPRSPCPGESGRGPRCNDHGRSLTPLAHRSVTSAMRAARTSGRRVVASI